MIRLHGIHLQHHKGTADSAPVRMPIPDTVTIPMSMHIGAPAVPCVSVGDHVKVGQKIGSASGFVSSPVYASVSGDVLRLDELITISGSKVTTVVIKSDGKQELYETPSVPAVDSLQSLLAAMAESGIVGLGGAGFPTTVKLAADINRVDTIVVNGAECEPYITSDTRTMVDDGEWIAEGARMLMKYFEVDRLVLGIESNKPQCIANMKKLFADIPGATVKALPSVYPQGGEKVLVYHTLGRVIGEGKLPLDSGVIVINCTTLATLAKFVKTGMPLVEKVVTVDGSAVKNPQNVIVPIGTRVGEVFDFCGGFSEEPKKILLGGPMMGTACADADMPVLKQTNAILAFGEKEARPPKVTPCIKCGRCVDHCPFGLSPVEISKAYKAGDCESLEKLKVNLCMECGCCSYVCPAKRNIVQRNKMAKTMLRNYQIAKKEAAK